MSTCHPGPQQQRGFNVIELMTTVAIVAILVSLALPSFNDAIERNRIAAAANDFNAAINYARTEAIRRNSPAGVCASSDNATCVGGWADGWIVWATNMADPTVDDVLRQGEFSARDTFSSGGGGTAVEFNMRGALASTPATFALKPSVCSSGKPLVREFTFALTGNLSMAKGNCT